jgi:hypothetical protein
VNPEPRFGVDLYWMPLVAGGQFVRLNGLIYEAVAARRGRRARLGIYHSALVVLVPAGRFVIEQAGPIPAGNGADRGVVAEGPVGTEHARSLRWLRYEVRRWRDGVIADIDEAVDSPQLLTDEVSLAQRVLELVAEVPTPVWGRDELATGEMWNSNSLISWLIAKSGLDFEAIAPPSGGRAPGWPPGSSSHNGRTSPRNAGRSRRSAQTKWRSSNDTARRRHCRSRGGRVPVSPHRPPLGRDYRGGAERIAGRRARPARTTEGG